MTMTESPPAEAAEAEPKAAAELAAEGLYAWLSTSDHKVIGRIWIRLSLLLLVAATAVGAAVAFEQVDGTDTDIFGGLNGYFQMWGLYRFGMVLLVVALSLPRAKAYASTRQRNTQAAAGTDADSSELFLKF